MRAIKLIFNKYLLAGGAFAAWMMFFDQNDWPGQQERHQTLEDTKQNISYLNAEIDQMDKEYKALKSDPKAFEKYARERYRMKRDGEDLYVIEK